jgi:hypothetical protein
MNDPAGTAPSIPAWLAEHCHRLSSNDSALTNLCLNVRRLDEPMTRALALALKQNSVLMILNLTSTFASCPSAFAILAEQGLVQRTSCGSGNALQVLHLSYNRLDKMNVSALTSVLSSGSSTLISLHLDHNVLDSAAACTIAQGLLSNKSLRTLNLSSNYIDDDGCFSLAKSLQTNTKLTTLDLSSNQITMCGASELLHVLKQDNYTLTALNLDKNENVPMVWPSRLRVICQANQLGRKELLDGSLPPCLWPRLLCRANDQSADLLWYLLRTKPDMLSFQTRGNLDRKRSRDLSLSSDFK